jgi:hypothetical protein
LVAGHAAVVAATSKSQTCGGRVAASAAVMMPIPPLVTHSRPPIF